MRSISPRHFRTARGRSWQPGRFLLPDISPGDHLDFAEVFSDTPAWPVEIEVGTGKGTFIIDRAARRGEVNFLGIEYARSYAVYAADRMRRAGLTNARMLCADAGEVFARALPEASVMRVHIYFPDPWPKRRHHVRRLIQPGFVAHVRRVLMPGGQLLLVTDHRDYFQQMLRVTGDLPHLARTTYPRLQEGSGYVTGTNFERKYVQQGRPIFKLALLKYR